MTALVWTRSPMARDTVSLALSRAGLTVEVVIDLEALAERLAGQQEEVALILGPSFTLDEADEIGAQLADEPMLRQVVLIEDLSRPLPCRTVVVSVPTRVLTLPLRVRPLLEAVAV